MFFFGPLHVLFIYGLKRVGDIFARDEAIFEEIQVRAAKLPPAERQAAIDSMKNSKDFEREVFLQEQKKEKALVASHRRFWLIFWGLVIAYFVIANHYDFSLWGLMSQPSWFCPTECQKANAEQGW